VDERDRGAVIAAFDFDASGAATVTAAGRAYQVGRFEVLRLCELRSRALAIRSSRSSTPSSRSSSTDATAFA
jgi:hypothetical protein